MPRLLTAVFMLAAFFCGRLSRRCDLEKCGSAEPAKAETTTSPIYGIQILGCAMTSEEVQTLQKTGRVPDRPGCHQ